ncbi:MAG: DUF2238 domain-containing protein [Phycisphaerales bacterium]|nr:DUF2238 domain-containing protein [Phycisphaerales bacterium]
MLPIIIFNVAYMLAAVATAIAKGNKEFIFYIGVMVVLMVSVLFTHQRVKFSKTVLWGLSIWGLLHMAGGLVPVPDTWPINGDKRVLYSLWFIPGYLKYDNIVHAYGFGVTTLLCWEALRIAIMGRMGTCDRAAVKPTWGLVVLAATSSMGFGALNEVVEFAATRLMDTNVGGYVNTGWDLVSNAVGATAVALAIRCWPRPS